MSRIRWQVLTLAVVVGLSQATTPAPAKDGPASLSQAATPAQPPVGEPGAKSDVKVPEEPTSSGERTKHRLKSILAIPACSVRYAAAKISGKLHGRKWVDFRRDECGQSDTRAVFPEAIAPKYSGEEPEKARAHTCADQFTVNKASGANAGMNWIDKNGGYYGECVSRLRG